MQVKKYVAINMQEAIQKIKKDLGSNAIIVSTKKIKPGGGAFGLFGKPMLEVTAARELSTQKNANPSLPENEATKAVYNLPSLPTTPLSSKDGRKIVAPLQEDISELKDILQELRRGVRRDINDEASVTHMRYELSELKKMIGTLITESGKLENKNIHQNLLALYQQLTFNGVEEKFARRLIEEGQKKIPKEEIDHFSYVKLYIARMFMQVIKMDHEPLKPLLEKGPSTLAFIGPTGVGKTTSIAKIAAIEKTKFPEKKIALITIDTFRIAAVQQLQEYGRIIKLPVRVVATQEQFKDALQEFQEKDLILIDTAGRSQRDEMQMTELKTFLQDQEQIKKVLVLSTTTKNEDLTEITKRFGTIPLGGVLFTKLDESTSYGSIFNHAIRFKIPLMYLGTGQNVPEDLEVTSRERLIDILLNISGDHET